MKKIVYVPNVKPISLAFEKKKYVVVISRKYVFKLNTMIPGKDQIEIKGVTIQFVN